jgi:hypothetical protein
VMDVGCDNQHSRRLPFQQIWESLPASSSLACWDDGGRR